MRIHHFLFLVFALAPCNPGLAQQRTRVLPPAAPATLPSHGLAGISEAQLSADFWLAQLQQPDQQLADQAAVSAQNARLLQLDPTMNDLHTVPVRVGRQEVTAAIGSLSRLPPSVLYDVDGRVVEAGVLRELELALALDAIPAQAGITYGLAVRRTALRKFPTGLRVFSARGETDIDRFQESALFPGSPVAILHRSRDEKWLWVTSRNYQAWVAAADIATGNRDVVLGYAEKQSFRLVTGARVSTVFTREAPAVSELLLDMGTRIPLAAVATDAPVNGQHPYTSWVLELPARDDAGALTFVPALLQKNQDSAAAPLPLTRANLIRQSFKFLGERYGWGHSYNGRDCSGFVSEVYRSMGLELPRNTRDQSISPALSHTTFGEEATAAERRAAVDGLQVGDLIYIPGHVMMMIGRIDGAPYVIHDTNGGSYLDADGELRSLRLNAVSVTPLLPLRFNRSESYVDRITSIVRPHP